MEAFRGYDYVVAPSGSCAGMLKHHLPHLFDDDPNLRARADGLAARTFELISFLTDMLRLRAAAARGTFRDGYLSRWVFGAAGTRREAAAERLLEAAGVTVTEMAEPEICCGFGGTFCVKYPEISARMVTDKTQRYRDDRGANGAGGRSWVPAEYRRPAAPRGRTVDARHVAEVLAETDVPPIGGAM